MRGVDVVYSLPDILVIVLLTEVFQALLTGVPDLYRRLLALGLALGLVSWVSVARLVRGLVLQAREEAWVEAARAMGVGSRRLLLRYILPNISGPILVTATFRIPAAVLAESTVSFLGLGIQPPFASWGVLASDGFAAMRSYPHLILFPSLALLVTLIGFHLLGDALRDRLDPRGRA
jgi:oligopeptide transport system permease protein